jgi:hypothetical protein
MRPVAIAGSFVANVPFFEELGNSTRKILTGWVKLYRVSSRALEALSKRSSFEKESVLRTSRPFTVRDVKLVLSIEAV